jgi:hypothetical protein
MSKDGKREEKGLMSPAAMMPMKQPKGMDMAKKKGMGGKGKGVGKKGC